MLTVPGHSRFVSPPTGAAMSVRAWLDCQAATNDSDRLMDVGPATWQPAPRAFRPSRSAWWDTDKASPVPSRLLTAKQSPESPHPELPATRLR